jgi:hypothetical protein
MMDSNEVREQIIKRAKIRQLAERLSVGDSPIFAAERQLAQWLIELLDETEGSDA